MFNTSLNNIYRFIQYMGLIEKQPNLKILKKNIQYFNVLTNIIYEILNSNNSNLIKRQKLYQMNIFDQYQIEYIIDNQNKIIQTYN